MRDRLGGADKDLAELLRDDKDIGALLAVFGFTQPLPKAKVSR